MHPSSSSRSVRLRQFPPPPFRLKHPFHGLINSSGPRLPPPPKNLCPSIAPDLPSPSPNSPGPPWFYLPPPRFSHLLTLILPHPPPRPPPLPRSGAFHLAADDPAACRGNKSACSSPAPSAGQAGLHLANHRAPRTEAAAAAAAAARRRRIFPGQGAAQQGRDAGERGRAGSSLCQPRIGPAAPASPLQFGSAPPSPVLRAFCRSVPPSPSSPLLQPVSLRGQTRPEPGGTWNCLGQSGGPAS